MSEQLINILTYIVLMSIGFFAGYMKGRHEWVKNLEPRIEELEVRAGLRQTREQTP